MKIEAWMCDYCSSISKDKELYNKCMAKCIKKKKKTIDQNKRKFEFQKVANSLRLSITNIHDLPEALKVFFKDNYNRDFVIDKFNVHFDINVSNSHRCPINGKTNWGGDPGAPRGYPGWRGQVEGHTNINSKPIKHPVSGEKISSIFDMFEYGGFGRGLVYGINSCGGGGGEKFSFTAELFMDDFPHLKKSYDAFLALQKSYQALESTKKKLTAKAVEDLIEGDDKYKSLTNYKKILDVLTKSNSKSITDRYNQIMNSKKFKDSIIVQEESNFDSKKYIELVDVFRGRH